ncbi:MAG: hypothetical protein KatS3mg051_1575 [Anaerolineae bacterium]|nr:MAG: hypothetical protein KatS3mg051_1575 [Anaerolineae bacterium]
MRLVAYGSIWNSRVTRQKDMDLFDKLKAVLLGRGVPEDAVQAALEDLRAEKPQDGTNHALDVGPRDAAQRVPSGAYAPHRLQNQDGTRLDVGPRDAAQRVQSSLSSGELADVRRQMEALQQALLEEKRAREEAVRSLEEQRKRERQRQIQALLDDAVKARKIEPAKRDTWAKRLEDNFDLTRQILDELPVVQAAHGGQNPARDASLSSDKRAEPSIPTTDADKQHLLEQARAYLQSRIQAQA